MKTRSFPWISKIKRVNRKLIVDTFVRNPFLIFRKNNLILVMVLIKREPGENEQNTSSRNIRNIGETTHVKRTSFWLCITNNEYNHTGDIMC